MKRSRSLPASVVLSGTGFLTTATESGDVLFVFAAEDGLPPSCGQIHGRPDLLERAYNAGWATLWTSNAAVHIDVIGQNKITGALIVRAGSIFDVIAKLVRRAA